MWLLEDKTTYLINFEGVVKKCRQSSLPFLMENSPIQSVASCVNDYLEEILSRQEGIE